MKYVFIALSLFLKTGILHAMPECNFFTQKEIISSYRTLTPDTLKDIYFINIELDTEKIGNHFKTVVFDENCNVLYKRNVDAVPNAIFSLNDTSNIVFITKFSGNSYAVDAYLVGELKVTPVILDLHSVSYPMFDSLKNQIFPYIISCTDACNVYEFDPKIKYYIKSGSVTSNEPCAPVWMSSYKPAWRLSNEKRNKKTCLSDNRLE